MFFSWFLKQNNCPFSYFCTEISGMEDSKQVGEGVRNSHALCIKVPLQWLMVPSVTHKTTRRRFMENLINSYKKWWIAGCRWGIYRSRSPLDTKQTSKISWWLNQSNQKFIWKHRPYVVHDLLDLTDRVIMIFGDRAVFWWHLLAMLCRWGKLRKMREFSVSFSYTLLAHYA